MLAAVTTAMYFFVLYALRPLSHLAHRFRPDTVGLRVTYLDGRGVLRDVLNAATTHGFVISDVATVHVGAAGTQRERADDRDRDVAPAEPAHPSVDVTLVLTGHGDLPRLTDAVSGIAGVLAVRTGPPSEE